MLFAAQYRILVIIIFILVLSVFICVGIGLRYFYKTALAVNVFETLCAKDMSFKYAKQNLKKKGNFKSKQLI